MVFIKKMICMGFKSFRKRTVIHFDKGFTAIVGANGSGKSNIIDAFVFVLGELSAKTLRANNIKDLISNGGNGLGPAQTATVEIIFDNADHAFAINTPELSIMRKIDRKGNGIYKLNGKRSTRKEIMNLLDLAGLAPNSSNMIMQGELFRLINMNATERRELIEEIAGIASYNERKITAEQELKQIQENLGQISLLLNEVYIQMEQLQKEKDDALHYLELQSQEKLHQQAIHRVKMVHAKKKINEMKEEQGTIQNRIRSIKEENANLLKKNENVSEELNKVIEKIKAIETSEVIKLTSNLKKIREKLTEYRTSVKFANKTLEKNKKEIEELKKKIELQNKLEQQLTIEIDEIKKEKEKLGNKLEEEQENAYTIEKELQNIDRKYLDLKNQIKIKQDRLNQITENKYKVESQITVVKNQLKSYLSRKNNIEKVIYKKSLHISQIEAKIKELEEKKRKKLGLKEGIDESPEQLEKMINHLEKNIQKWDKQKQKLQEEATKLQKELIKLQSKAQFVKQWNSGNSALKAIKKLKNNPNFEGIYGTIAELGTADPKFAIAFEMAAGNRFNFVVVDKATTAEKCIRYLKENKLGRASFIPLDKVRTNPYNDILPSHPKIYGRAIDLISFDPLFEPAFEFVFGRVVITEDITIARQLNIPARRVTLDGDIVDSSNVMTGGQKQKSRGLGFQSIDTNQINKVEGELFKIKEQIDERSKEMKAAQYEISRLYKMKLSGATQVKEITEQIAIGKAKIKDLRNEISESEQELREILSIIKEKENELENIKEQLEIIEKNISSIKNEIGELENELSESPESDLKVNLKKKERNIKLYTKELNKIEIKLTKKETTLSETLKLGKEELKKQLILKEQQIQELNIQISEEGIKIKELEAERSKLEKELSEKNSKISEFMKEKQKLQNEISKNKMIIAQNENKIHPLELKLQSLQLKSEDTKMKIQEWQCLIVPNLEIPEKLLQKGETELQNKLNLISSEKNAMGAVNLRAIEKYKEIEERFHELEEKNEKVIDEREAILNFIEQLESEKLKVFMKTYNAINQNFGYIFSKLSPGGEAKLEIENMEDPFSGGLEILARPGEKEWCLTQAMSGGEKTLTIIALILGIQMHVPSPYYILDEIDAALDDANAALVASMIKELSGKSQFIIITHRDATMTRTDHLLGVSNREGVTSVVNLSIRQIMAQIKRNSSEKELKQAA